MDDCNNTPELQIIPSVGQLPDINKKYAPIFSISLIRYSNIHTVSYSHFIENLLSIDPDFSTAVSSRAVLINWLVDVVVDFRLHDRTLFLAVSLVDRFISHRPVCRNDLQLLGVTCLFIASKFEELDPPKVSQYSDITAFDCSPVSILHSEVEILNTLNFDIVAPHCLDYLDLFCYTLQIPTKDSSPVYVFSKYLIEISFLSHEVLQFTSSIIAASSLFISLATYSLPLPPSLFNIVSIFSTPINIFQPLLSTPDWSQINLCIPIIIHNIQLIDPFQSATHVRYYSNNVPLPPLNAIPSPESILNLIAVRSIPSSNVYPHQPHLPPSPHPQHTQAPEPNTPSPLAPSPALVFQSQTESL